MLIQLKPFATHNEEYSIRFFFKNMPIRITDDKEFKMMCQEQTKQTKRRDDDNELLSDIRENKKFRCYHHHHDYYYIKYKMNRYQTIWP